MDRVVAQRVTAWPLVIPLRRPVSHAAAQRKVADPVVVSVELSDGTVGFGETLPRDYVTGESVNTVLHSISKTFVPALLSLRANSFPDVLAIADELPWRDADGIPIPAARAAIELALLDAGMKTFGRTVDDVVQWIGLGGFGTPGSVKRVRYSGVLTGSDESKIMRQLRLMYWGGLRDFKIKVGWPDDEQRLGRIASYLRRPIAKGRATIRVDANGCWSLAEATQWVVTMKNLPICSIEQPLARGNEHQLVELKGRCDIPLMHDESLIDLDDARRLIELGIADGFNIRISKCGGLIPALRLAGLARRHGTAIQLGCMVGETSILSAAGIRFLQHCPDVRWAEGCFGQLLLSSDVTERSLRFGFSGRPPALTLPGLGIEVDEKKLASYCPSQPMKFQL